MSKITNDGVVWHRMLYSGAHMATVGVNGLRGFSFPTNEIAGQFWGKSSKVEVTGGQKSVLWSRFPVDNQESDEQ